MLSLSIGLFGLFSYCNEAEAHSFEPDSSLLHVKEFINNAIPFWVGDNIPQFNNPNEISNDDLLNLLVMSNFTPKHHDQDEEWIQYISVEDVENTAKTIFGPDIKKVQHEDVHLFLYDSNNRLYSTRPVGGGIPHTEVHIIDIRETDNEYIVDAVHAYHSFNLYDMMEDPDLGIDIYDDWGNYVLTLDNSDEEYSAYLPYLPVRRYILTKTNDESYYLSQSYIVGISAPGGTQPIDNLIIGDRVLDSSWEWDFGFDAPLLKPVVWIVVAKDHYGEGSGVTLLSEDIIGHPIFDDSTVVSTFGNNHWGKSGTADASNGLRPWLNSKGLHKGEGFYEAFSEDFKSAVLERGIPCIEFEYDSNLPSPNSCSTYISYDKVFIPSALELGGNPVVANCLDGKVFPFFDGAPTTARIASKGGTSFWYWTRTPSKDSCDILFGVDPEGNIKSTSEIIHTMGLTNMGQVATRAVVNIKSDTMVSSEPAANDIYLIDGNHVESTGTHKVAYIPVKFKETTADKFIDLIPGNFISSNNLQPERSISELKIRAGFVTHYFKQQTYNNVDIVSDFISDDWIELDKTLAQFQEEAAKLKSERGNEDFFKYWNRLAYFTDWLIIEAAMEKGNQIKPGKLNFTEYKNDNAYYDAVAVIQPGQNTPYQGVCFKYLVAINDRTSYGLWAHEFGHAILGYADYYSGAERNLGDIGYWGLMGSGTDTNPPAPIMSYNRYLSGWHDFEPIDFGEVKEITPLQDMQPGDPMLIIESPTSNSEYFILEGRQPPDGIIDQDPWYSSKFWAYLKDKKGVLIYKVVEKEKGEHVYTLGNQSRLKIHPDRVVTIEPGAKYIDDQAGIIISLIEEDSRLLIETKEHAPKEQKIIYLKNVIIDVVDGWLGPFLGENTITIMPVSMPPMENDFDVDLKVFTKAGAKVGMCYETGYYLMDIPGARSSGKIGGAGPEWISVPDDISIYYEIDTTPMVMWLDELFEKGIIDSSHTELENIEISVTIQEIAVDETGKRTVSEKSETIEVAYELPLEADHFSDNIMVTVAALIIVLAILSVVTRRIFIK